MQTITLAITGMTCGHCVSSVREALAAVPGVEVQGVDVGSAKVRVADGSEASTAAVLAAVQDAGYEATVQAPTASSAATGSSAGCVCCATSEGAPVSLSTARSA